MQYSVIIPGYNCEATLEKTVGSILKCGLQDFEILLVDDGSKDGTPALCDRLAAEHDNIRVFHQPNGGVSSARNRGLEEARGEYVWFFDCDDLVDPGSMERAAQIVNEKQPDMLIFGMRFEYYTKSGKIFQQLDLVYDGEGLYSREELIPLYEELFHCNALSSVCNKLFRRERLQRVCFDERLFAMEDFHFVLTALERCETVYLLPSVIYRYLHRPPKTGRKGRVVSRAARIRNIASYIQPFEPLLSEHPALLLELYFMLLRQKIGAQMPEEIEKTAQQFSVSKYAAEPYVSLYTDAQKALAEQLRKGRCLELYQRMEKARRRQRMVGLVKESALYRAIKGTEPKKARF